MFYVLEGAVRVLSGTQILRAQRGDLIVVPPHLPHAFSAEYGSKAEILIVIAPGVERFEYFRKITRIA
jgi:quercetin dioxygenase-like cupin family protein